MSEYVTKYLYTVNNETEWCVMSVGEKLTSQEHEDEIIAYRDSLKSLPNPGQPYFVSPVKLTDPKIVDRFGTPRYRRDVIPLTDPVEYQPVLMGDSECVDDYKTGAIDFLQRKMQRHFHSHISINNALFLLFSGGDKTLYETFAASLQVQFDAAKTSINAATKRSSIDSIVDNLTWAPLPDP